MYTREILAPSAAPIENGIPLQGTWTQSFNEVDLLVVQRPFLVPIPRWMRNYRIKEWESFIVQDERVLLAAALINLKYYCWVQVFLFDKESKELTRFRKLIPFGGWQLPRNLSNASVESRSYGFFFRIHSWLGANTIRVDLDIKAKGKRPSLTAHLDFNFSRESVTPMAVSLLFSERRSMYAYKSMAALRGDIAFGERQISLHPKKTSGLFSDVKGFFPYRMHGTWCTGCGFYENNRRFGFSVGENQAKDSFANNENALWVNGTLTPLPPVRITMPHGVESDWVIQDLEGMVDLTFSPQEIVRNRANLIVSRAEYETPLGYYNGMLLDSKGEQIPVKNLWGLGERVYIRV